MRVARLEDVEGKTALESPTVFRAEIGCVYAEVRSMPANNDPIRCPGLDSRLASVRSTADRGGSWERHLRHPSGRAGRTIAMCSTRTRRNRFPAAGDGSVLRRGRLVDDY